MNGYVTDSPDSVAIQPADEVPLTAIRMSFQIVDRPIRHGESNGGVRLVTACLDMELSSKSGPILRNLAYFKQRRRTPKLQLECPSSG